VNGFTYVQTKFDYASGKLNIVREIVYSKGEKAKVRCYGADDVREGVAIITTRAWTCPSPATPPTHALPAPRGRHLQEGMHRAGKKYFSVASGGGTGRTLHPDNMAAGPASYGMTDTMGRMHSDAQFAGSSSVPAHVEMMGFLGMGNNPWSAPAWQWPWRSSRRKRSSARSFQTRPVLREWHRPSFFWSAPKDGGEQGQVWRALRGLEPAVAVRIARMMVKLAVFPTLASASASSCDCHRVPDSRRRPGR